MLRELWSRRACALGERTLTWVFRQALWQRPLRLDVCSLYVLVITFLVTYPQTGLKMQTRTPNRPCCVLSKVEALPVSSCSHLYCLSLMDWMCALPPRFICWTPNSKCDRSLGGSSAGKESSRNARDLGSIPGLGRFPGERNGYQLQYSGLENSMDRGAWWAKVHGGHKDSDNWVTFAHIPCEEVIIWGEVLRMGPSGWDHYPPEKRPQSWNLSLQVRTSPRALTGTN